MVCTYSNVEIYRFGTQLALLEVCSACTYTLYGSRSFPVAVVCIIVLLLRRNWHVRDICRKMFAVFLNCNLLFIVHARRPPYVSLLYYCYMYNLHSLARYLGHLSLSLSLCVSRSYRLADATECLLTCCDAECLLTSCDAQCLLTCCEAKCLLTCGEAKCLLTCCEAKCLLTCYEAECVLTCCEAECLLTCCEAKCLLTE